MTNPNPLDLEQFGELVQPSMQTIAKPHQMLDIIDPREVYVDEFEESGLGLRQIPASKQL